MSVSGEIQFSLDGKWIAYASSNTGHMEVYVGRFNGSAAKIISDERQISTNAGQMPHWRSDGKEIYFRTTSFQPVGRAHQDESDV